MAILTNEPVQIIRGLKADIAQRTGSDGEFNWATDSKELYIHDGKTRGGHLIGKVSGTAGVVGGAGIAVSTSDGISTVSIKRDPSSVLYATTDGAGVRLGNSGGLQVTAQNALDLHLAEGGGLVVDSNGLKVDSSVLTSVFRYAGQVNSVDDLPDDASIGDVYDVKDSGANYVWTGSSWDNLGGILSVDPSPTQGSANPVASGGVYDAIQAVKLSGDGKTVTVASNTITAKDIAIGGDESDLASARGQIGKVETISSADINTIIKTGCYCCRGITTNAPNNNGIGFLIVYSQENTNGALVSQLFILRKGNYDAYFTRNSSSNGENWKNWNRIIDSQSSIGDGITVNNGIISVPEYEGATADTAATSGLVPPAAAGEQDKYLGGDGEWHEIAVPSAVTLSDSVTSDSSTTAASSKAVKTAYDRASIAITNASTAKSAADAAQEAADAAQTTANEAKTAAQNAASAASTAQSTASAAQSAANTAQSTASTAQTTANTAKSTANSAKTTATNAGKTTEVFVFKNTSANTTTATIPSYGTWGYVLGGRAEGAVVAGGTRVSVSAYNVVFAVRKS